MTTSGMPWVKLYTAKLDDLRLVGLDHEAQLHFYKLLLLAAELDAGGAFVFKGEPITEELIALRLRHDVGDVKKSIKSLKSAGLLRINGHGLEFSDFLDEQGPTQEEKRAYWRNKQIENRSMKRLSSVNVDSKNVNVDTKRVKPTEKEKIKSQSRQEGGGLKTRESSSTAKTVKAKAPPSFSQKEPKGFKALREAGKHGNKA